MNLIKNLIGTVAGPVFDVIDKAVEDKDQAARLKAELQSRLLDQQDSAMQARMKILLGEIQGESWLQRNWRPLLMTTITVIIANNYAIAPYLSAMFNVGLQLELPERMWDLMTIGVGGYIAGRSGEKIAARVRGGKTFIDRIDR